MLENVLSLCKSSPAYVLALSSIIVFRNNLSREEWAYRVRICQWQLLSMLTNADHHQTKPDIIFDHAIALAVFLASLQKLCFFDFIIPLTIRSRACKIQIHSRDRPQLRLSGHWLTQLSNSRAQESSISYSSREFSDDLNDMTTFPASDEVVEWRMGEKSGVKQTNSLVAARFVAVKEEYKVLRLRERLFAAWQRWICLINFQLARKEAHEFLIWLN